MVQPKFNNDSKSKPATEEVSKAVTPKAQSEEEWREKYAHWVKRNEEWKKKYANWISYWNRRLLVDIVLWCWRLLELTGYGPLFCGLQAARKFMVAENLLDSESWEPSKNAQTYMVYGILLLSVVILQLDAFIHVFICKSSIKNKTIPDPSRTDLLFKYIQFCIPQVLLGGFLLLQQPNLFDPVIPAGILCTLIWNTCSTLLVLIENYIRLLEKKRSFEKKISTPNKDADEMLAISVT